MPFTDANTLRKSAAVLEYLCSRQKEGRREGGKEGRKEGRRGENREGKEENREGGRKGGNTRVACSWSETYLALKLRD